MTTPAIAREFEEVLGREPLDLARAALVVSRIESTRIDPAHTLSRLGALGERGAERIHALGPAPVRARIAELNRLLYEEERFAGNREHYGDFRNSLLNEVVERRLGIPISLALVWVEVARRAGIEVFGVSFPGHFLLRIPDDAGLDTGAPIVIDPFSGGRELDRDACGDLLRRHVGDAATFEPALLATCTGRQWLTRMLNNLKRTYIELRSFPQARVVTDLMFILDPASGSDLRDRGLLAYHLDDFTPELRDLEHYLRLKSWRDEDRDERERVLAHVKTLRGRVAELN